MSLTLHRFSDLFIPIAYKAEAQSNRHNAGRNAKQQPTRYLGHQPLAPLFLLSDMHCSDFFLLRHTTQTQPSKAIGIL
jgi:hypothetical protein